MDNSSANAVFTKPRRSLVALGVLLALSLSSFGPPSPAQASDERSEARVDLIVDAGGIIDPALGGAYSVLLRADETGTLSSGDVVVSLTEDPFTSEEQIRRFISGDSEPVVAEIAQASSPEVPQLESREMIFGFNPEVLSDRVAPENADDEPQPGIFGLEVLYSNPGNIVPGLRQLVGRQILILVPAGTELEQASIAPIVTLTTSATGGQALSPSELEAQTIEGGPLSQVARALETYPASLAIDSRITSSITVLSDQTQLPVTINNDLASSVVVSLRVRPTTGILAVEQPFTQVEIAPESSIRVFVPVQSLANGSVPVEFSLLSAGGQVVGEVVTIPVTIRAGWEGVISFALAGLVGGVFTFGLIRAIQRRRSVVGGGDDDSA